MASSFSSSSSSIVVYQEQPDFISQLPDPILCLIFSHLPAEELVRTSILSKRYISLYRFVPSLTFVTPRSVIVPKEQPNFPFLSTSLYVGYLLSTHATSLVSCKISHYNFDPTFIPSFRVILTNWIRILNEKRRVQELSLTCVSTRVLRNKPNLMLQEGAFSFQTLTSLEISNYAVESQRSSCFKGCRNLRKLRLQKLAIMRDTLNQIIKNCEDLETLILENMGRGLELIIRSDKLRFFEIRELELSTLDLQCIALEWMKFDNIVLPTTGPVAWKAQLFVPNMSKLILSYFSSDFMRHYCMCSSRIFKSLCDVNEGALIPISAVANVKVLQLSVCLTHVGPALAFYRILETCTNLEVLHITFTVFSRYDIINLPCRKEVYWTRMLSCEGVENHLRRIKLDSFIGNELEIELVKFILSRATKLDKVVIHRSRKIRRNGRMFLRNIGSLALDGASPNISIKVV